MFDNQTHVLIKQDLHRSIPEFIPWEHVHYHNLNYPNKPLLLAAYNPDFEGKITFEPPLAPVLRVKAPANHRQFHFTSLALDLSVTPDHMVFLRRLHRQPAATFFAEQAHAKNNWRLLVASEWEGAPIPVLTPADLHLLGYLHAIPHTIDGDHLILWGWGLIHRPKAAQKILAAGWETEIKEIYGQHILTIPEPYRRYFFHSQSPTNLLSWRHLTLELEEQLFSRLHLWEYLTGFREGGLPLYQHSYKADLKYFRLDMVPRDWYKRLLVACTLAKLTLRVYEELEGGDWYRVTVEPRTDYVGTSHTSGKASTLKMLAVPYEGYLYGAKVSTAALVVSRNGLVCVAGDGTT